MERRMGRTTPRIESSIQQYYKDSNRETLVHVLDAIHLEMEALGSLLIPVSKVGPGSETGVEEGIADGENMDWLVAFTSLEEACRESGTEVCWNSIRKLLQWILRTNCKGLVLNPYGQAFLLTRELTEILFAAEQEVWNRQKGEQYE